MDAIFRIVNAIFRIVNAIFRIVTAICSIVNTIFRIVNVMFSVEASSLVRYERLEPKNIFTEKNAARNRSKNIQKSEGNKRIQGLWLQRIQLRHPWQRGQAGCI